MVRCWAGAKLVSYNVDIGEWVFETFHWSRYAMSDDDDGDGDVDGGGGDAESKAASAKMMPPPPPVGPAGRMPRPRGAAGSKGAGSGRFLRGGNCFRSSHEEERCPLFFGAVRFCLRTSYDARVVILVGGESPPVFLGAMKLS